MAFTVGKISAAITAIGGYIPEDVLSNAMLEKMVEINDEWIYTHIGIRERRILKDPQRDTSFSAIEATKDLLNKEGLDPRKIDLLILTTATPDIPVALTGPYVASQIGIINAFTLDLQTACSSFLFDASVVAKYIESGRYKKVLLVGASKMSSTIDYTDHATCILFGDEGRVAPFEPNYEGLGVRGEVLKSNGVGRNHLYIKAGDSLRPATVQTIAEKQHFVFQDGKTVFKCTVTGMADVAEEVLKRDNLTNNDAQRLTPHQTNKCAVNATIERVGLPVEKVVLNIHKYGNTISATIILTLNDYEQQLEKGGNMVLAALGGGFTWGAIYLKWAYDGARVKR